MSRCPDWRRLDPADRDAPGAPHAAARWQEALRHLDGGCPRCWQEALAADPTLVFRRLPAPDLGQAEEAEEVAAARLAVAAMRTASRLEGRDAREAGGSGTALQTLHGLHGLQPRRTFRNLQPLHAARWALAAGLTAMALIFGSGHGWHAADSTGSTGSTGSTSPAAGERLAAAGADAAAADAGGMMPLPPLAPILAGAPGRAAAAGVLPASSRPSIEGLSRPEARVYQIDSPHMSVVMIVDDKLDV
ncbi:MAG TPA: hypothetical protein VMW75_19585 [Thermoanaerobaculia bacterium]|nr:hypothetical protein [Thermoanaerobaculia bacterium]